MGAVSKVKKISFSSENFSLDWIALFWKLCDSASYNLFLQKQI